MKKTIVYYQCPGCKRESPDPLIVGTRCPTYGCNHHLYTRLTKTVKKNEPGSCMVTLCYLLLIPVVFYLVVSKV